MPLSLKAIRANYSENIFLAISSQPFDFNGFIRYYLDVLKVPLPVFASKLYSTNILLLALY